jgi:hypothetical protein
VVDEEFNQRRARAMSFSKERRRPAWYVRILPSPRPAPFFAQRSPVRRARADRRAAPPPCALSARRTYEVTQRKWLKVVLAALLALCLCGGMVATARRRAAAATAAGLASLSDARLQGAAARMPAAPRRAPPRRAPAHGSGSPVRRSPVPAASTSAAAGAAASDDSDGAAALTHGADDHLLTAETSLGLILSDADAAAQRDKPASKPPLPSRYNALAPDEDAMPVHLLEELHEKVVGHGGAAAGEEERVFSYELDAQAAKAGALAVAAATANAAAVAAAGAGAAAVEEEVVLEEAPAELLTAQRVSERERGAPPPPPPSAPPAQPASPGAAGNAPPDDEDDVPFGDVDEDGLRVDGAEEEQARVDVLRSGGDNDGGGDDGTAGGALWDDGRGGEAAEEGRERERDGAAGGIDGDAAPQVAAAVRGGDGSDGGAAPAPAAAPRGAAAPGDGVGAAANATAAAGVAADAPAELREIARSSSDATPAGGAAAATTPARMLDDADMRTPALAPAPAPAPADAPAPAAEAREPLGALPLAAVAAVLPSRQSALAAWAGAVAAFNGSTAVAAAIGRDNSTAGSGALSSSDVMVPDDASDASAANASSAVVVPPLAEVHNVLPHTELPRFRDAAAHFTRGAIEAAGARYEERTHRGGVLDELHGDLTAAKLQQKEASTLSNVLDAGNGGG